MRIYTDSETINELYIEVNQSIYTIKTKFRSRNNSSFFDVNKITIAEENNEFLGTVEWMAKGIGVIEQIFVFTKAKRHHNSVTNVWTSQYSLDFIPTKNVDGIIDQSIGFEPIDTPYFMIPGHVYNTNNIKNSKSIQPQLNYRGDISYPKTPTIYTRADRSTHNGVIAINTDHIVGLRIDEFSNEMCEIKNSHNKDLEYLYNGLSIDTNHVDSNDRIGITMGYHHFPKHYFGKLGELSTSPTDVLNEISFGKDITYSTKGHLYMAECSDKFAYEDVVQFFYEEIHEHPDNEVNRQGAVSDLLKALGRDSYNREYHYFPTVLSGENADTLTGGDTAWTGGMQVAYPMIKAANMDDKILEIPLDFIENLIETGFNDKANMFYESKTDEQWSVSGWWKYNLHLYDENYNRILEGHSAYVNGQATCYLIKAYNLMTDKTDDKDLKHWLKASKKVIDHVIKHQRYDGALGVYFNPDNGNPIYYNSFQGAWFLAGIAELYKLTKKKKYKDAFYKANDFYKRFIDDIELWGMPMDIQDGVDEEGNLAYITALKTMHEATHDKTLLETLIHCFHYEYTWKFAYNTVHVNEPLKSLNWSSSGGSITSSHNIHIHQMGNLVCEEMYYVYQITKDPYILSRLKDTLNWGLGTHNSEYYDFGFGSRGWATEQFFHSDGKQDDFTRVVDGGIWYDYLSWAAACVLLSSSLDIPDELYYK